MQPGEGESERIAGGIGGGERMRALLGRQRAKADGAELIMRAALALAMCSAVVHAFHVPGAPLLGRWAGSAGRGASAAAGRGPRRLPHGGALQLRGEDGQGDQELDEIVQGIAQLQAGVSAIKAGLKKQAGGKLSDAQQMLQATTDTASGKLGELGETANSKLSETQAVLQTSIDTSLTTFKDTIGADAYMDQIQKARDAVLQNIGIGEQFVPEVTGPSFQLSTAVWLAGAAFDAYIDPEGGLVKKYSDGTRVSFLSSDALAQLHTGVLMVRVKSAALTPKQGLFGSTACRCDPYVTLIVNGAEAQTATVKNNLTPEWDEQLVMYTGDMASDTLQLMVYDADLLMGKEELDYLTPDPLVGLADIPLADIAAKSESGWLSMEVPLVQPPEPKTRADVDNSNNPYWLRIPREAMVQTWPSLLAGGAAGGTLSLELRFLPLNPAASPPPAAAPQRQGPGQVAAGDAGDAGGGAASAGRLIAQEWALLAAAGADDSADGAGAAAGGLASLDLKVLVQENLEQLAFLDNVDTDTQVMRPPSWTPA